MKDLKHLYYFENLLQDVNNDLVRQAQSEGRIAIGTTCYQLPEILFNLPGCFSLRLRAPRTGGMELGTYYMTSLTCEYCRAMLERALEGGYQFLDCIFSPASCSQLADCVENLEALQTCTKEKFFIQHVDTPMKNDENGLRHMVNMSRARVLQPLHDTFGIDISDHALREAVKLHNEICRLITEIGDYRKEENPRITGYEFTVLCLATYCCPKDLLVEKLQETAEELKTREPDADYRKKYRARVLVAGSEMDDPELVKVIEEAGALVVADRYCFGSLPGRQELALNTKEDVLTQICRQNVEQCQCPRYMDTEKVNERKAYIDQMAKEYHADGILIQQMKFCNFWGYERAAASHILREEYGWPVLSVDRPYVTGTSGQMRTRVQAFVESIEIKKIQGGQKAQGNKKIQKAQGGGR